MPKKKTREYLDIVFDMNEDDQTGEFVEVEFNGRSIRVGKWIKREDGYYVLRITPKDFEEDEE